jgi:hypothetical protein
MEKRERLRSVREEKTDSGKFGFTRLRCFLLDECANQLATWLDRRAPSNPVCFASESAGEIR